MMAKKAFKSGRGYTRADWDTVDPPEMTDAEIAKARPFTETFPELAQSIRRGRGPAKKPTKKLVSLRLSPVVLEHFKSTGPGWQRRIDDALVKIAKKRKAG